MGRIIYLQKIGKIEQSILIKLKSQLERELKKYNIRIKIIKNQIKLTNSEYNKSKEQFNALKILKRIKREFLNKEFFRILGILDESIYSKKRDFIFGLANMRSGVALISLTPLKEKFYKETGTLYRKYETEKDVEERILKEAIHELGHTFGLKHCNNLCVMRFSNSLRETDEKSPEFCNSCLKFLKGVLN
jgi:archaemetzincin